MSDAKKCDRCGEFEETVNATITDLTVNGHVSTGMRSGIPLEVHLCSDCQDAFRDWWRGGGNDLDV